VNPRILKYRLLAAFVAANVTPLVHAGTLWDGGAADDLFGSGDNWDPNGAPSPGSTVDLTFGGTTRLTPNNNYTAFDDFRNLDFAAGAGSFVISGNAIDLFGRVENQSTNLQTVSLALAINGGQPKTGEFNPVNGDLLINGSDLFTNGNTVQVWGNNGKTVTFNTVISQAGGITVNQNSNVVLLGANTYGGATAINAGTLTVGGGGTSGQLGSGSVSVAAGSALGFNRSDAITVSNAISGAGSLTVNGGGTVAFNNQKTYSGGTTIQSGVLDLTGGGGATGTIRGTATVNTGGTLRLSTGDATGYDPVPGSLTTINLNGGTLNINTASNQTLGGAVINMTGGSITGIANSNLDFFNTTSALNVLSSATTSTISGTKINLRQNGGVTFNVADGASATDLLVSSVISNSSGFTGNNLKKTGAGTMQISAANTFTTAVEVQQGRLLVTGFNGLISASGVTVSSGATLELGATNIFVGGHGTAMGNTRVLAINGGTLLMNGSFDARFGNVTLNNGATWTSNRALTAWDALLGNTSTGAATVSVTGTGASTMNGSGGIHLQGFQNFAVDDVTGDAAADLVVTMRLDNGGTAGGTGGVTKSGAGTMLLNGQNSYTAGTVVNAGILAVDGNQQSNRLTNNHAVTVNGGAFEIRGVNALPNAGSSVDVTVNDGGSLNVVGGGSAAIGAGGQSHAHLRNLTLNGGSVNLSYSGAGSAYNGESFQLNGTVVVTGSAASTIQSSTGTANSGIALAGNRTFTVNDVTGSSASDLIVSAELENSDTSPADDGFTKGGAGTMELAAANSYSGVTNVQQGILKLGASGSIASSSQIILGASTTLDVSAVSGGWTLGGSQTLSGTGTVSGNTTIDGTLNIGSSPGTMNVSGDLGLGSLSTWNVELGGTGVLDFDRLFVSGQLAAGGTINVSLINSFVPSTSDSFQIANFGSFVDNGFVFNFSSAPLSGGQSWDTSAFATSGTIAVVPEPGVFSLIGLGFAGVLLRRRR
jgi:autotransporter-associated beta strand protein